MNKSELSERILAVIIVLVIAALFAFRPIPSIYASNDTGRYVADFERQCKMPMFNSSATNISWSLFYSMLRPICWIGEARLLVLVTVLVLPLAFLLFGKMGNGWLPWTLSAFLSVAGFELATNALRQGIAVFFLIFAFKLVMNKKNAIGLLVGIFSALLHSSNIAYLPLLFWLLSRSIKKYNNATEIILFTVLPAMLTLLCAFGLTWIMSDQITDYFEIYQIYYKETLSPAFIIFVSLPIYYVYILRAKLTQSSVTSIEKATVAYSSLLMITTLLFFPAIAYRFAFTSCILQIYFAMNADNSTLRESRYTMGGLLLQLGIFILLSDHARKVLFG